MRGTPATFVKGCTTTSSSDHMFGRLAQDSRLESIERLKVLPSRGSRLKVASLESRRLALPPNPPPPYLTTSPAKMDTLQILKFTLAWEATYQTLKLVTKHTHTHFDKVKTLGASYGAAMINALICTATGAAMLAHYLTHNNQTQTTLAKLEKTNETNFITMTMNSFLAWILYDLTHLLTLFPRLGGIDTIIHHCGFALVTALAIYHQIFPFAAAWLLLGEVSSIPLNIRWYLINTQRGDSKALNITNICFAIFFFIARVVIYWVGLIHMLLVSRTILLDKPINANQSVVNIICTLVAGGGLLNAFWFNKILKMAKRRGKNKR